MTVQKYLKNLKTDCQKIQARIDERVKVRCGVAARPAPVVHER